MLRYQLVDEAELCQELPRLPPGAVNIVDLKDQGQGMKIVNELATDVTIELPDFLVFLRNIAQRTIYARRFDAVGFEVFLALLTGFFRVVEPEFNEVLELLKAVFFYPPNPGSGP